jgi:hypothetical protein
MELGARVPIAKFVSFLGWLHANFAINGTLEKKLAECGGCMPRPARSEWARRPVCSPRATALDLTRAISGIGRKPMRSLVAMAMPVRTLIEHVARFNAIRTGARAADPGSHGIVPVVRANLRRAPRMAALVSVVPESAALQNSEMRS